MLVQGETAPGLRWIQRIAERMVHHQFSITDCWRDGLLWHPGVLGCLQMEAYAGWLHENQRICHPTIWHTQRPHANMQNKSRRLYVLSGSVGKFQFVLQSSALWWTYNSCSVMEAMPRPLHVLRSTITAHNGALCLAWTRPEDDVDDEHAPTSIWTSFKHLLLLELQLRESTLNEHDWRCLSAVMVVFGVRRTRTWDGSFLKCPANVLLPSTSCVPHNIWQSNGQMGPVSFDLSRRRRALSDESTAGYWSLPSAPRLYSAEQTRLKAPFRPWCGAQLPLLETGSLKISCIRNSTATPPQN